MFKDKFYRHSFCDMKRKEFMSLVHGSMSVTKYEKIFIKLAKYIVAFVIDEVNN